MHSRPWLAALSIAGSIVLVIGIVAGVGALPWNDSPASLTLVVVVGFAALLGIVALVAIGYGLASLGNANEALGLPAGSVRALVALLIIVMFAVMSFYFVEVLRKLHGELEETKSAAPPAVQRPAPVADAPADRTTTAPTTAPQTTAAPPAPPAAAQTPAARANAPAATTPAAGSVADLAKLVLQILGTLMTTIVGFYFGSKTANESTIRSGNAVGEAVARALQLPRPGPGSGAPPPPSSPPAGP